MLAQHLQQHQQDLNLLYMTRTGLSANMPVLPAAPIPGAAQFLARKAGLPAMPLPRISVPWVSEWSQRARRNKQQRLLLPHADGLFHGTNYAVPDFDGPKVATFHDITILTHPAFHPPIRVKRMTRNMEHAARCCQSLITVSGHSRDEMVRHLGLDPSRIYVTPLGPRPIFKPRTANETAKTLATYNLHHKSYVLFCGTIEPRKNTTVLLKAYQSLPASVRATVPLVIAGGSGWNSSKQHDEIRAAERTGEVRYTGYVNDAVLADLFSSASVMVNPSVTEGFGLPVVEAMASDVPVLCSTGGSLPEVAGAMSACFDPHDWEAASKRLMAILNDEALRNEMIADGRARLARFSWQDCARLTVDCYAEVMNQTTSK